MHGYITYPSERRAQGQSVCWTDNDSLRVTSASCIEVKAHPLRPTHKSKRFNKDFMKDTESIIKCNYNGPQQKRNATKSNVHGLWT